MTTAILGAGLSGLAAARTLTQAGQAVVLYEKSRGVGGRVAARRVNGCILDHGAQVIKPDGSPLATVMFQELPADDLLQITAPVRLMTAQGRILPPEPIRSAERQFTYRSGITTLPKLLFKALPADLTTFYFETRIERLTEETDGVHLWNTEGEEVGKADRVLITAPAPQTADLLASSTLYDTAFTALQIEALRAIPYSRCLSVLLGYAAPAPEPPAYALLAEDRTSPLLWLAFEQVKSPERAPQGEALLIAQLGPALSLELYEASEEEIVARTLAELQRLFGTLYATPLWQQVKQWKFSQPRGMAPFGEVNRPDSRVLLAGDALRPENGRVHQAYASGLEAAHFLLTSPE